MLDSFLKTRFHSCDVYFWDNGGPTDDYMARYGNEDHEYLSGTVDGLLRQTQFDTQHPKIEIAQLEIIQHLKENLRIGRAYLEYKGLVPEDPTCTELREANR